MPIKDISSIFKCSTTECRIVFLVNTAHPQEFNMSRSSAIEPVSSQRNIITLRPTTKFGKTTTKLCIHSNSNSRSLIHTQNYKVKKFHSLFNRPLYTTTRELRRTMCNSHHKNLSYYYHHFYQRMSLCALISVNNQRVYAPSLQCTE